VAVLDGAAVAELVEPMVFEDPDEPIPPTVREAVHPPLRIHPMPALAIDRVVYVGQPAAMVVAIDRYVAEDALELIGVAFEPLPAVLDAEAALAPDAPIVEPAWPDNLAISITFSRGDVAAAFAHVDTPSPLNPPGVKGLGEGGAIGPPAAIANAVEDALIDLGVVVRRGPLSPARVRELIREAASRRVDR
jgi:CO/xanthine dehydrogenase Mo-binding subunit